MRLAVPLALLCACARPAVDGPDGALGSTCAFSSDGILLLVSCQDGSLAVVREGIDGVKGVVGAEGGEGPPGPDGRIWTIETVPAPAEVCPAGGIVVSALEGDDVRATQPVCRPAPACDVVYGDVILRDPLQLVAFAGAGCRELRGGLSIQSVNGPHRLPAFAATRWSAARLRVQRNRDLRSVDSLLNLSGEIGSLEITDNPTLRSLVGLEGITAVRGPFTITGNGSLPRCEAEALRDRIGLADITGPITIEGTAEPCQR